MSNLVEEVLDMWRAAERVLEQLPSGSPDRETIASQVEHLRRTYARLTDGSEPTPRAIRGAETTIERARAVVRDAEDRSRRTSV